MNILVPINNFDDVKIYLERGANEFYMGFYDNKWQDKFGVYGDLNRLTGYGKQANRYSFSQIISIIPKIKSMGGSLFITFNSSMYSGEQLEFIEEYLIELKKTKVDGVIISCPELIKRCEKNNLFCVMSTIAGSYNTDIIKFYQSLGARRVIIPRDVTLKDMEEITKNIDNMEFEVFIMRSGCRYSDSNCLGLHRSENCTLCGTLDLMHEKIVVEKESSEDKKSIMENHTLFKDRFHNDACGLCAIYDFLQMGINACKVVGRKQSNDEIKEDIFLIKKNIDIANHSNNKEQYLSNMIFPKNKDYRCDKGLSCYYPEVRF